MYNTLSTVLVVPLSSSIRRPAPFHVPLKILGKRTYALVDQLRAVDVERRLKEYVATIAGTGGMDEIDNELKLILGLHEDYRWL
jgi:mRNA-degrading endonuclease toxin of MazEF toxin-antitoxin module